jgi:GDP-4-dehydro-6-deoxy-D-mannose reductase
MTNKKLFVTGLDGFVGNHVRHMLKAERSNWPFEIVESKTPYDLKDINSMTQVIESVRPDYVLHLAGQSSVPASFENPLDTHQVNFLGTMNLLDALKKIQFTGSMVYTSSGEVYGRVIEQDMPVTELHGLKPQNPYSVSKVAAEFLCQQYSISEGMNIIIARPFNHVGPGQSERFAVSSFAKQVAEIALGLKPPMLSTGSLDTTRDFTDVRDVVRAYLLLLLHGKSGEIYNICSGRDYSMEDILQKMFEISGVKCSVTTDPSRLRANEQKVMRGSFAKIQTAIGWQPQISIEQSLQDAISAWKEELV